MDLWRDGFHQTSPSVYYASSERLITGEIPELRRKDEIFNSNTVISKN